MKNDILVASVVSNHTFTVNARYKFSSLLGLGSYGVVAIANDSINNKNVAVKRIRPYAKDELVAKYALREIKCLKLLKSHPNVNYYFKFQRWH